LQFISNSVQDTQDFARKLAQQAKPGDVYVLEGELGAGKTMFVQGLAQGIGVKQTEYVASPSFVIAKDSIPELITIGLEDYIGSDGVCVLEWGNKIEELLPEKYVHVHISIIGETQRKIVIIKSGV